jgi:hypothetical protein
MCEARHIGALLKAAFLISSCVDEVWMRHGASPSGVGVSRPLRSCETVMVEMAVMAHMRGSMHVSHSLALHWFRVPSSGTPTPTPSQLTTVNCTPWAMAGFRWQPKNLKGSCVSP